MLHARSVTGSAAFPQAAWIDCRLAMLQGLAPSAGRSGPDFSKQSTEVQFLVGPCAADCAAPRKRQATQAPAAVAGADADGDQTASRRPDSSRATQSAKTRGASGRKEQGRIRPRPRASAWTASRGRSWRCVDGDKEAPAAPESPAGQGLRKRAARLFARQHAAARPCSGSAQRATASGQRRGIAIGALYTVKSGLPRRLRGLRPHRKNRNDRAAACARAKARTPLALVARIGLHAVKRELRARRGTARVSSGASSA